MLKKLILVGLAIMLLAGRTPNIQRICRAFGR